MGWNLGDFFEFWSPPTNQQNTQALRLWFAVSSSRCVVCYGEIATNIGSLECSVGERSQPSVPPPSSLSSLVQCPACGHRLAGLRSYSIKHRWRTSALNIFKVVLLVNHHKVVVSKKSQAIVGAPWVWSNFFASRNKVLYYRQQRRSCAVIHWESNNVPGRWVINSKHLTTNR